MCLIRELKEQLRQHQDHDENLNPSSPQGKPTAREHTPFRADSFNDSSIASCRPSATPEELLMSVYTPTGYLLSTLPSELSL